MQSIEIFKPGTHKSMDGRSITFSESDLRATAAAYSPQLHEAPLVIGHPQDNAPAYGWAQALSFAGSLKAVCDQVDLQFAELVNSGKFKKRSASFYAPDHPSNPVPGVYYLRHIGFLGAMPPSVKGMKDARFAEEENLLCFADMDFGDYDDRIVVRMFRNIKNLLIAKFGQEEADQALAEYDLDYLTEEALRPETPEDIEPNPAYAENKGGSMAITKEELEQREKNVEQREAALKLEASGRITAGNLAFCEGLVQEGKLLAANKAALAAVLDFAAGVTAGDVIEFGEGDAKKSEAPLDTIKALFAGMPKIISFGEFDFSEEPGKKAAATHSVIDVSKYV